MEESHDLTQKMNPKQQLVRSAAAWGTLLAFMGLLKPDRLPVVVLILPFVLVYVAFYSTWRLFGLVRARYFVKDGEWKPHRHLGMAICGSMVLLLVLQSLGQLSLRDVITLLAIVLLGYLYLTRSRFMLGKQ
jgi:hypothetical protein